jgi:hypothetical protein
LTIITTVVSHLGIVQLSDSLVSGEDGKTRMETKLFRLESGSVLALAGAFSFQGQRPADWLAYVDETFSSGTVGAVAERIGRLITINATDYEREQGHLIHLAGYRGTGPEARPEMWFVRSWAAMDQHGDYDQQANPVLVTEDFWSRYESEASYRNAIDSGGFVYFVNGVTEGRVALNKVRAESPSARTHDALASLDGLAAMFVEDLEKICGQEVSPFVGGEIRCIVMKSPVAQVTE